MMRFQKVIHIGQPTPGINILRRQLHRQFKRTGCQMRIGHGCQSSENRGIARGFGKKGVSFVADGQSCRILNVFIHQRFQQSQRQRGIAFCQMKKRFIFSRQIFFRGKPFKFAADTERDKFLYGFNRLDNIFFRIFSLIAEHDGLGNFKFIDAAADHINNQSD